MVTLNPNNEKVEVDIMEYWEVDLRSRKDGNSVETIFSGEWHDEACDCLNRWYQEHTEVNIEMDRESLIDGTEGVFADIYSTNTPHGIGKWNKNIELEDSMKKTNAIIIKQETLDYALSVLRTQFEHSQNLNTKQQNAYYRGMLTMLDIIVSEGYTNNKYVDNSNFSIAERN